MGKRSYGTRGTNSSSASKSRKASGGVIKSIEKLEDVKNAMNKYHNLYDMPKSLQKKFLDNFPDITLDHYNKKSNAYSKANQKAFGEALKANDKNIYERATAIYEKKMHLLNEERQILSEKYTKFIQRRK